MSARKAICCPLIPARKSMDGLPAIPPIGNSPAVLAALREAQHENGGYLTTRD